MALTESELAEINAQINQLVASEYRAEFENVYTQAHHIMGQLPDLASEEILNLYNHHARALESENFSDACLSLRQGLRHLLFGTYLCMYQMLIYLSDAAARHIETAEEQGKKILTVSRMTNDELLARCRSVPRIVVQRDDSLARVEQDIVALEQAIDQCVDLVTELIAFRNTLLDGIPLDGSLVTNVRQVRKWFVREVLIIGLLAIFFNVLASAIYDAWIKGLLVSLITH